MTDGLDFLVLTREIRDNPPPLISCMLDLKKVSETKSSVITIQASEEIQPLIKYFLRRIEELSTGLTELEKRIGKIKQSVRELQEESLKNLSHKSGEQPNSAESKTEKRQFSLSNIKVQQN